MDWEREYELIKSSGADPIAGPSFTGGADDDEGFFNDDAPMAVAAPRRGGDEPGLENEDAGPRRVDLFPEDEPRGTPLEQLSRHWMNERHAPDILPAQEELLTNLLDHLRRQVRLSPLILCHGLS